jgi:hypothetical protein
MHAAERFLKLVPVQTRGRGQYYHATGHVLKVTCVRPDQTAYTAVVRGSEDYVVTLTYSEQTWVSACSCPMHYDCKHTVATMLELQRLWAKDSSAIPATGPATTNKPAKKKSLRAPRPLAPQPSASPLYERLMAQLGRPLDHAEASFVRKVQNLYDNTHFRQVTDGDLNLLFPQHFGYGWAVLDLWPKNPQNDYELWLYLAVELHRRKIPLPDYLAAITDFTTLEADIKKWERQKEVARWEAWFESNETSVPPTADTLDLRLAFLAEEARLQ